MTNNKQTKNRHMCMWIQVVACYTARCISKQRNWADLNPSISEPRSVQESIFPHKKCYGISLRYAIFFNTYLVFFRFAFTSHSAPALTHTLHNFQSMLSCRWLYLLYIPFHLQQHCFRFPPVSIHKMWKTYSIYPISCIFES